MQSFEGKPPGSEFLSHSVLYLQKKCSKIPRVQSSPRRKLCIWGSVPCCLSHAALMVLTAPCALPAPPWPSCLPWGLPTLWLLPVTETCPAAFPPRSSSCGAFRCSDLEHYHVVFLLWKQDHLTGILTSVLFIPEDKWPSLCPRANSTKHSHACDSCELFYKACKHFKSFCTSISEWSLLPLDSSKQLLKLLENFQLVAGINSDTNLFLGGSFPGLAAFYQHLTAFHPTLLTIPMWEKGREKWSTKQPEGSGMAEEMIQITTGSLPARGEGNRAEVSQATDLQPQMSFF